MASNYRNRSTKKPKPKKPDSPSPVPRSQSPSEKTAGYETERHPSGAVWNRKKRHVIAYYNGICHLCQHPGALQVDHLVPYAETHDDSIENLRPAHGTAKTQKNPCPVCKLNCNNIRGSLSVEAGKRKIAARQGNVTETPPEDSGREW